MKVIVGSKNPVKIKATRRAFEKYFDQVSIEGVKVESGVSHQPFTAQESFQGAFNRAQEIIKQTDADFAVGIEGGIEEFSFGALTCGWVVILNREGKVGVGTSARMMIPKDVIKDLKENGLELGEAMDRLSGEKMLKHRGGMFGFFSKDVVSREEAYYQGVIFALSKFVSSEYYNG